MSNKVLSLSEAADYIRPGSSLAIGGNTLRRHPMALVREIARKRIKGLIIYTWVAGMDVDLLVGAGCVSRVESAYVGMGAYGLAPNMRRAVQNGRIDIEDFTETSMMARLRAAGMGLPFLPTKALLGTDMAEHASHAKPITCPFTGQQLHAVSAARADFAILHGHYADKRGNIFRPVHHNTDDIDVIFAKSSKRVIVSVEQVVSSAATRVTPTMTQLPHHWVDAVVEAPYGAHPGSCDFFYNADAKHIDDYLIAAKTTDGFKQYLERYVYGTDNDWEYLDKACGTDGLLKLKATG